LSFADIDRGLLGREFDRAEYGPVTAEELIAYARKLGETEPAYVDETAARRGPDAGLVAHPSFVVKLRGDRALPEFVVRQMRSGGFDAGKDIEFGVPIRPGDTLSVRSSVHDVYEKTGRSGRMVFLVLRTEVHNQRRELVAIVDQRMMQKA
jgi:acyl dehydratase